MKQASVSSTDRAAESGGVLPRREVTHLGRQSLADGTGALLAVGGPRVDEFRYHPSGASWASANRRSFLKNGERAIRLELGCEGNSPPNQAVGTKTEFSLRATS